MQQWENRARKLSIQPSVLLKHLVRFKHGMQQWGKHKSPVPVGTYILVGKTTRYVIWITMSKKIRKWRVVDSATFFFFS